VLPESIPTYYDILTAAEYTGSIQISLDYTDYAVDDSLESELRLLHWDAVSWNDATDSVTTDLNRIHGTANSLSPFGLALPLQYTCGDADASQILNISDAVYLISYIFGGGPEPIPLLAGDADYNEIVNIADPVYLISYIFGGGPEPCVACP
jgi:hypothetical protein